MKNIRKDQIRTCVVLHYKEFDDAIRGVFGNDVEVEDYDPNGGVYLSTGRCSWDEVCEKLKDYFDVKKFEIIPEEDVCPWIDLWFEVEF